MNLRRLAPVPALIALAAGVIAAWGCNKKPTVPLVAGNQPPLVRITAAPIDTTARNYYVITLNWIGSDPDGRVDRFLFAVDPPTDPGADTLWEQTTENQLTRSFPCPSPDVLSDPVRPDSSADFHVFVIKAVDNEGALSPPASRAFWSYTVAPTVRITNPPANPLVRYYVTPAVLIRWEGEDSDGVFTQKPVKYKFTMLTAQTEVSLQTARSNPDSVRKYYAPRFWAGWDSLPGDTTQKQFTGLTPASSSGDDDGEYVFVVVAFDEAGAYSPIFSFNNNMVYLRITFAGAQNPKIVFYNEFFLYEYEQGSYRPTDPAVVIPLEVPAGRNAQDKLTFNWYADPARDRLTGALVGGPIRSYRWAVDIVDVFDETERSDEETDLARWSQKSFDITSCRIGPYPGGECHKFYLEAEDVNNLKSLGIVQFCAVQATFAKRLLIVDDTRYLLDKRTGTTGPCIDRPVSLWPSAAELDTFLFARGGVPWRCYPEGTVSTPGIFNGYDFDTTGTNLRTFDLTIRLSRLGQYQHVVWLVDGGGALNNKPGTDAGDLSGPTTSMRYMNDNRKANTIAAYVRQGGRVWLAGGGAGTAALMNFNRPGNDNTPPNPRTLTFRFTDNELVPGRFIYEQAHWRSEFKQYKVNGRIKRYLGRFDPSFGANPGIYGSLPAEIQLKSSATDPFPPNRAGQSPNNFYQAQFDIEFLSAPNEIIEDLDQGPLENFQSTLDTIYKVTAAQPFPPDTGNSAQQSVVMTYYNESGLENVPFVMTGFSLWSFRRAHCKALVDFVLQNLWGLPPPTATAALPARSSAFAAAPAPPGSARAAPLRQVRSNARPWAPAAPGSRN